MELDAKIAVALIHQPHRLHRAHRVQGVSFSLLHEILSSVFHAVGKRAKVVCPHEGLKTAVEEVQINGPEEVCHVPPPRRVHNLVGTKAVHIQLPKCGTSGVKGHAGIDFRDIVQAYIVWEKPVHDIL
jgi:anthranilate phosphoribosyltransferase